MTEPRDPDEVTIAGRADVIGHDRHSPAVPLQLACPACDQPHIDGGVWKIIPHKTHRCEHCGMEWRPHAWPTVGIEWTRGGLCAGCGLQRPSMMPLFVNGLPLCEKCRDRRKALGQFPAAAQAAGIRLPSWVVTALRWLSFAIIAVAVAFLVIAFVIWRAKR